KLYEFSFVQIVDLYKERLTRRCSVTANLVGWVEERNPTNYSTIYYYNLLQDVRQINIIN
ncbi:MAG: hypothetical protein ACKPJ4_02925, partial [Dolichospermum sp.]